MAPSILFCVFIPNFKYLQRDKVTRVQYSCFFSCLTGFVGLFLFSLTLCKAFGIMFLEESPKEIQLKH